MTDGALTVAVVDDDGSVLESIEDLLKSVGYSVRSFSSADALLMSDALQTVDCIITDICLPGVSGFELEQRALQRRPGLPVILLTARDEAWKQAQHLLSAEAGRSLFRKPVDGGALLAAIKAALAV